MKKSFCTIFLITIAAAHLTCQPLYTKGLRAFRDFYISQHEVVKGNDKKYFRFFTIDSAWKVKGSFEKIKDTTGFTMKTSAGSPQHYYKYGRVSFRLRDTALQLFIYQSKTLLLTSYKDYLFVPFTDLTTGVESYGSGRYLDLLTGDIKNNQVILDFNKAYNPYCAYADGFQCPLPPRENDLPIAVKAGEKTFAKPMH